MVNDITYRPMRAEEAEAVSALVVRVFQHDVAPYFGAAGIRTFLDYAATAEGLLRRTQSDHVVWVAQCESAMVGMIEMRHHDHISLFFVAPEWQRRGIGKALLQQALAVARQASPPPREISVHASPNAVTAYERLGFRATAPQQEQDGIAFVPMTLALPVRTT